MASVADLAEAECGPANPLTQLSKHLTEDLSRREELLGHAGSGPTPERLSEPIPLHPADVFVEEFLATEEQTRLAPETFHMNDLLREMLAIDAEEHRETMRSGPIRGPSVAEIVSRGSTRWADEFLQNEHFVHGPAAASAFPPTSLDSLLLDDVTWMGGPIGAGAVPVVPPPPTAIDDPAVALAADWTEEFEAANPELTRTANQLFGTIDKPRFSNAEFMKFVNNFGGGGSGAAEGGGESPVTTEGERVRIDDKNGQRVEFSSASSSSSSAAAAASSSAVGRQRQSVADKWAAELEAESRASGKDESQQLQQQHIPSETNDSRPPQDWESEFLTSVTTSTLSTDRDNASAASEFMEKLQREWEAAGAREDREDWFQTFDHATFRRDAYAVYFFDPNNPFSSYEGDAIEEGRRRLRRGDLANAILLFEAAVQRDPSNPEAWQLLGTSQAENEQEPSSIAALRKCVELAPGNLTAWMALAVSYTNESLFKQGCEALRQWFNANEKYRHIGASTSPNTLPTTSSASSSTSSSPSPIYSPAEQRDIQTRFIEAVRETTARNEFDFELQSGLGVLFNISGEYDKAVDCFKAALKARPDDAPLWNRLGATLANGNRSEEAVHAYNQALRLSPGFVRCRYNLGIACINLSAHRQAVEHLLTALKLQSAGIGPVTAGGRTASMSDNIWSTLRLAVSLMGRTDLLRHVNAKNMDELGKEFPFDDAIGASF